MPLLLPLAALAHPHGTVDPGPVLEEVPRGYACQGITRNADGVVIGSEYLDAHGNVVHEAVPAGSGWEVLRVRHVLHTHGGQDETLVFWTLDEGGDGIIDNSGRVTLSRGRVTSYLYSGGGSQQVRQETFIYDGDGFRPAQRFRRAIVFSTEVVPEPNSVETYIWRSDT